jgi:hypothetical protein
MDLSTSKYGRLKYTIKLADLVALGASLTGDIPLDSLPPGAVIQTVLIKASTAVVGVATGTAQLKFNGNLIGTAIDVKTVTGNAQILPIAAADVGSLTAANPLVATLTATTNNWNVATAGQIDVVINYHTLGV